MEDTVVAHFAVGRRVVLEDGGGWAEGSDRIWSPSGWVYESGRVRIPVQHHEEPGASEGVDIIIRENGTTMIRGDGRVE